MRLINTNQDRRLINPWFNLQSFFDDDFFSNFSNSGGINLWEDNDKVYVELAVPGLSKSDVDVNIENNILTVRGAKESNDSQKEGKKVYSSSMRTNFFYSTTLPSHIDPDKVEARLENGVLALSIDKLEKSKPKKIEIKSK